MMYDDVMIMMLMIIMIVVATEVAASRERGLGSSGVKPRCSRRRSSNSERKFSRSHKWSTKQSARSQTWRKSFCL